jgi:acyl carrier protein
MGLDGVEIVMAVEDAFDITIENSEAEKCPTPGQLIELAMSKVATTTTQICLTHRSFNLLRGFLVSRYSLGRKTIRPDTLLSTAFPTERRFAGLQQLSADLAIQPCPPLVRPLGLKLSISAIALAAGVGAAVPFAHSPIPIWIPASLTAIGTAVLGVFVTRTFCTEFPDELSTVGHLARWIMTHKPDLATAETTGWTREQVAARVREIVIQNLCCESTYREDARFIQDLGLS